MMRLSGKEDSGRAGRSSSANQRAISLLTDIESLRNILSLLEDFEVDNRDTSFV